MLSFVKAFAKICILRLRPQDLPSSDALFWLVLLAHTGLSVVFELTRSTALGAALLMGLADTGLLVGMTGSVLAIQGYRARFKQTVTAMIGAATVLGLAALSIFAAGLDRADQPGLIFLILVLWQLVVIAHVLRHALSAPFYQGLILAAVFFLLTVTILPTLSALTKA